MMCKARSADMATYWLDIISTKAQQFIQCFSVWLDHSKRFTNVHTCNLGVHLTHGSTPTTFATNQSIAVDVLSTPDLDHLLFEHLPFKYTEQN